MSATVTRLWPPASCNVPQRRRSGRTSAQICLAPMGALFIWGNDNTSYPHDLAAHLNRGDLHFAGDSVLYDPQARLLLLEGDRFPAVVLDHALADRGLDGEGFAGWLILIGMVVR